MNSQRDVAEYRTPCGLTVLRETVREDAGAFTELAGALDERRGMLLASHYEYPGRYRRSQLGFCNPPLVLETRARAFSLRALNARGLVLLRALAPCLAAYGALEVAAIRGVVAEASPIHGEEERTRQPSVLSAVRSIARALSNEHDTLLGLYGAFGYDLVFQFEQLARKRPRDEARELVLYLPDELLTRDATGRVERHRYEFSYGDRSTRGLARDGELARHVPRGTAPGCDAPHAFERNVARAKEAFARGDLFEVTLSQTYQRAFDGLPSQLFARLTADNPAPYCFFANLGSGEFLIGASPEMYVRVSDRRVETCPIAGTIARGRDALDDSAQIRALLASEKEEAELTMCTDVDRNDKARICEPGSVRVIGRRQIELYSRLIHTVDHVEGTLRAGYDAIDALLTHMWAVTVTGAPKIDAMQFIEDHEAAPRAFYGAAVGVLRFDGSLDTGLTLRTVHLRDGVAEVRAGATLLFDSEPASEARECELKASAVLAALRPREPRNVSGQPQHAPGLRVLLIDHRDSFVHTLADYFRQASCDVRVLRHGFESALYDELAPQLVVLSPGPLRPADFAMHTTLGELSRRRLPVFGVCLGMQGMVEYEGGALAQLSEPRHGKPSPLRTLVPHPLFFGLPEQFTVGRYHSLHAQRESLPSTLVALAESEDDRRIMAIAHRTRPWCAVQFHPESILSARDALGLRLIGNVVAFARSAQSSTRPPIAAV